MEKAIAKTAAERQKEYQAIRQLSGGNGERRVSAYVTTQAALVLHRLANHFDVTQRQLFENLLIVEEGKVLKGLSLDSPAGKKYLGKMD